MTNSAKDRNNTPSHFVGIGASAGGLEALQTMLSAMPANLGACFIIVQHLSPDFKSMMQELLSKNTNMNILNVVDGMQVQTDTIYLIPPKKNMVMKNGKLLLSDKDKDIGLNLPIDVFFRSLAEDKQHKAIGIILSGTGTDGTRGIKALKEAGALVIAQQPDSAKFDGMPNSAIGTGIVDLILPPSEIGNKLNGYIKHPLVSGQKRLMDGYENDDEETKDMMSEIFGILKASSDIDFTQYKKSTVMRRIERRMTIHQMSNLQQYLNLLYKNATEAGVLAQELLIGVTRFFRDYESFKELINNVIPQIVEQSSLSQPIRVWASACSTGEEAYSLAILINEELEKQDIKRHVKIFATDINPHSIADASSGIFSSVVANDIPKQYLERYFHSVSGTSFKIDKTIRNMVVFASHNMITDPPFSKIDLVTCRNALIYFQAIAQQKVLSSFHFALRKGGYMFLGSSENLGDIAHHFKVVNERARVYLKHTSTRLTLLPPNSAKQPANINTRSNMHSVVAATIAPMIGEVSHKSINSANHVLIERYAPPCILINQNNYAIHIHGVVDDFMRRVKAGRVSLNICDMINDDLSIPLNSAIQRIKKNEDEQIVYTGLATEIDTKRILFDLRVCQANIRDESNTYYWLIFEVNDAKGHNVDEAVTFDVSSHTKQRIQDLELELNLNKEHLQVTVEELETTNEELQSANEELMSANEELQSTNEELQSVNEELYTVNTEYQTRIHEISQADMDLDTVLDLAQIGVIFLDENMAIRRFTNAVKSYVNLLQSDIGRPIHHFSKNIEYDRMLQDIVSVFQTGESIETEAKMASKKVLKVTINPHAYNDDELTKGATIMFAELS